VSRKRFPISNGMKIRSSHEIASKVVVFFGSLFFIYFSFVYGLGFLKVSKEFQAATPASIAVEKKILQEESPKKDDSLKLIFVGDIMLSRGIGEIMEKNKNWHYPFIEIGETLKGADLTFGNLEGPISKNGTNMGSIYSFRADPRTIEGLAYSGFDVLSVANNHIWDYGAPAFEDTLQILNGNGMSPVGGGFSFDEAHSVVVRDVKGTKIAFLAYTNLLPGSLGSKECKRCVAFPTKEQIVIDIEKAKTEGDIVVVSFHWGDEYKTIHNSYQETFAHTAIDAGADLIIGHHPHVIQDTEKYGGGYIAYSLGNFVFDQNFSKETQSGMMLVVTVKDKKVDNIEEKIVKFNSLFQTYIEEY
jgi:poly-gamma-glutamate capsule biosynthesis protein CapA/YwtB (metallophosphatase superfamily)